MARVGESPAAPEPAPPTRAAEEAAEEAEAAEQAQWLPLHPARWTMEASLCTP